MWVHPPKETPSASGSKINLGDLETLGNIWSFGDILKHSGIFGEFGDRIKLIISLISIKSIYYIGYSGIYYIYIVIRVQG